MNDRERTDFGSATSDRSRIAIVAGFSDYRRAIGGSAVLAGLIVVVIDYVQGDVLVASVVLAGVVVAAGLLVWWTRPTGGGFHVSHTGAQEAAGDADVIVYWRPGRVHCDKLKRGLGDARDDLSWVNILRDQEAAEHVATLHGGEEVVPTAVTGAGEMIPGTAEGVAAQLAIRG